MWQIRILYKILSLTRFFSDRDRFIKRPGPGLTREFFAIGIDGLNFLPNFELDNFFLEGWGQIKRIRSELRFFYFCISSEIFYIFLRMTLFLCTIATRKW